MGNPNDKFPKNIEKQLLGSEYSLSRNDIAEGLNISTTYARKIWRTLGFPNSEDSEINFTEYDKKVLKKIIDMSNIDILNKEAVSSLLRAIGHSADRLITWEFETIMESLLSGGADASFREELLVALPQIVADLEEILIYAWRRHVNFAIGRLRIENSYDSGLDIFSVEKSVGFADLVSYTRLSQRLDEKELSDLVQRFQQRCSDLITVGRGRLVKTVGDEVLFIADTPEDGAMIALGLSKLLSEDKLLPDARVSMVWGKVLSRLGDVFGSTVNLASRLNSIAKPGKVLFDLDTAKLLEKNDKFILSTYDEQYVRGFGMVKIVTATQGNVPDLWDLVD